MPIKPNQGAFNSLPEYIQKFVDNILAQAGFDQLPDDFRAEYRDSLGVEVQRRLGAVALKELDDQALGEFSLLMEKEDELTPVELQNYYEQHIPDFQDKMEQALQQFAQEFIAGAVKLRDQVSQQRPTV